MHHEVAICYNTIANIYSKLKNPEQSIKYLKNSIYIIQTLYGTVCNKLIISYWNLAQAQQNANKNDDAICSINRALDIISDIYGNNYYELDAYLAFKDDIEKKLNLSKETH